MRILLCLLCFSSSLMAKALGTIGSVFPIAEESLLTVLEHQPIQTLTPKMKPIGHVLPRTSKTKIHTYLPEVRVEQDIEDAKGHILWKKGTRLNALQALPQYQPHWIFFDGEDEAQLQWVKYHLKNTSKLILTRGEIGHASTILQHEVYFDQGARLIHQLNIQQGPAVVTRDQDTLCIQEMAMETSA